MGAGGSVETRAVDTSWDPKFDPALSACPLATCSSLTAIVIMRRVGDEKPVNFPEVHDDAFASLRISPSELAALKAVAYDELVAQYAPEYIAGGATQNSIRVCAWMLKAAGRAGGACAFAGCVGDDANGAKLAECARAGGVEVAYQVDAEAPTGVCGVLVDPTNERTLVTRLDAANNFTKDHLETAAVQKLLVASKVVYSAGFFLTSGGPDCTALLGQHCADFGKRFCLNISAPFIAQFFGEALDATMPFVDILFANETEAAALGEARGWGSDVATVALKCCDLPKASGRRARCVVFTQGADSTIVACEGAVTTYPVTPLAKELLVDTNGAGDAFVGGFLSRLVLGEGWDACVKAGHYAAREIIQRPGCTVPDTCGYGSFF